MSYLDHPSIYPSIHSPSQPASLNGQVIVMAMYETSRFHWSPTTRGTVNASCFFSFRPAVPTWRGPDLYTPPMSFHLAERSIICPNYDYSAGTNSTVAPYSRLRTTILIDMLDENASHDESFTWMKSLPCLFLRFFTFCHQSLSNTSLLSRPTIRLLPLVQLFLPVKCSTTAYRWHVPAFRLSFLIFLIFHLKSKPPTPTTFVSIVSGVPLFLFYLFFFSNTRSPFIEIWLTLR